MVLGIGAWPFKKRGANGFLIDLSFPWSGLSYLANVTAGLRLGVDLAPWPHCVPGPYQGVYQGEGRAMNPPLTCLTFPTLQHKF